MVYTDPDGNYVFAAVFLGAMIGSFVGMINASNKGQNELSGAWKGAIVGGLGGLFGAFAPVGGFFPGAAYGAGTGAVTGAANSAIWGTNIGQGALLGGVTGGILGGIGGYVSGKKLGVNPWTGSGEISDAISMSNQGSGESWKTTAEMESDYNSTIGAKDNLMLGTIEDRLNTKVNLANNNNLSDGNVLGGQMYWKGEPVGGVTSGHMKGGRVTSGSTSIFISPNLKGASLEIQNLVFKHEFMHAWHWTSNLFNYNLFSERATSSFNMAYAKNYGLSSYLTKARNVLTNAGGPVYPKGYSWTKFGKIIPLWIK